VCWTTEAAVFLKSVKIEEKLLWRAYRNSPTLFRMVPSPTPYGLLFPKIGGLQPHPKLQSLLSQERVKLHTSNLAGSIRTKAHQKFWRKESVCVSRDCPTFGYPLLSHQRVKLRTSNFVRTFVGSIGTNTHKKFQEK